MAKYHGKKGYIVLQGIGIISELHGWNISTARDTVDTPTQCSEWHESIRGQGTWSGAFSAYYDAANVGKFYDIVNSTTSKDLYLYPDKTDMTKYFYGDAWADFDLSVPVDGAIDVAGTIGGTGQVFTEGF